MLRKAWDAEGSPFKGTPFDPSAINMSGGVGDMGGAGGAGGAGGGGPPIAQIEEVEDGSS